MVGFGKVGAEVLILSPQMTNVGAEIGLIAAAAFFGEVRTEDR